MTNLTKWQVLEEETICDSKWFPLFKQKVKIHDGSTIDDFYISRLGNIALIVPVLKTGEIVFIRQYRHATDKIMLELPAGIVEEGREILDVAVAELEEEIGIAINKNQLASLGFTVPNSNKVDMTVHGFVAKDLKFNSEQKLEKDENIEIVPLKPKKVLQMIQEGEIFQSDAMAFILRTYLKYPKIFNS